MNAPLPPALLAPLAGPTTNAEFLAAIFGSRAPGAALPRVCCFAGDPGAATPRDWDGWPWSTAAACDGAGFNWYFTLAVHVPDASGTYTRRSKQCAAIYGAMLDDVGTKGKPLAALRLPPSAVIETSAGNYQVLYLYAQPVTDLAAATALQDALIAAGLCDPNAKGPSARYGRLPFGANGKYSPAFACRLVEWHPDRRYTIEQIKHGLQLPDVPARLRKHAAPSLDKWNALDEAGQARLVEELRRALAVIPADVRGDWIATGLRLRADLPEEVGRPLWEEWSRTSESFDEEGLDQWDTFAPNQTGHAAVFAEAQARGWVNPRVRVEIDASKIGFGQCPLPPGCRPFTPAEIAAHVRPPAPPTEDWTDGFRSWSPRGDLGTRRVTVQWAVEGWIQAGHVGALVAAGGTGKTTLLLHLGVCIALCRPFFGNRVQQGSFVLLSNDDTQDDLDGLLARVVQSLALTHDESNIVERKVRVYSLRGKAGVRTFTKTDHGAVVPTGMEEQLHRAVSGMDDLVCLAIDTLRQFCGGSSNDELVITQTLDSCARFAQRTGVATLFAHHTGKQNYREGVTDMYAGSGSAAIADNSRFILLLQAPKWNEIEGKVQQVPGVNVGDPLFLKSTRGSALVKPPPPMFLHRRDYLIERLAERIIAPGEAEDGRDIAILGALEEGRNSKRSIAQRVGGKTETLNARVDVLIREGFVSGGIVPDGKRRALPLTLTDTGSARLTAARVIPASDSP